MVEYRQELDLRRGLLLRTVRFEDASGRRTLLQEQRLVSMADMHLGALEVTITAENWSGRITVRSAIDGRIVNAGAKLYRAFNGKHLDPLMAETVGNDGAYLLVRTHQSDLRVAQVARTQAFLDGTFLETPRTSVKDTSYVGQEFAIDLAEGETFSMEKLVFLYTSRDYAISECGMEAHKAMGRAGRFEAAKADHTLIWTHHWARFDVVIKPADPGFKLDVPMLLRLNMFHLLQTVSVHSIGLDVGIPPRGWTGEAYQGHIFWDELFMFPVFNYRIPEITRALLTYRFRRLGAMAGTVDLIQRVSTGIEVKAGVLKLNPELPLEMEALDMRIRYRGHSIDLQLTRDALMVRGHDHEAAPISLCVAGEMCEFVGGSIRVFPLRK